MTRLILLFLSIPLAILAQTPSVSCNGGINTVQEGQSITCTSTSPVTWTLSGVGSLSGNTSTTVTYTAPASLTAQNVMAGCPVFPNDVVYNTRIDNLPVNSNSATWVANVGTDSLSSEGAWGISVADASTPLVTYKPFYGGGPYTIPSPPTPQLIAEDGAYRTRTAGDDHHLLIVRKTDCSFGELYNVHSPTDPMAGECFYGGAGCNVQSAGAFTSTSYTYSGGVDAAGLSIAALTLHLDDIKRGSLNHALRFTSCTGCIYYGTNLWPATGTGGSTNASAPPYGARFRLRLCGVGGVTTNCVSLSNYSATAQIILTGLHQYGMFLADIGTENSFTYGTDIAQDPTATAAVAAIGGIPITDFEVVDESSLMIDSSSLQVNPSNPYETPLDQAIIVATPTGSGSAVSTSIALQGVTIGVSSDDLYVETGQYSYQIPFWVNGTSNQNVTWTLQSGPGSVTTAGSYTPPPAITSLVTNTTRYEFGTSFTPDVSGYIISLRMFRSSTNTGTIQGNLWNVTGGSTGTLLGSCIFPMTSSSAWVTCTLPSPIAVTAGSPYMTSYNTSGDYFEALEMFEGQGFNNGTLNAPANGTYFSGQFRNNGAQISASNSATFPVNNHYKAGYWADVVWSASTSGSSPESMFSITPVVGSTATIVGRSAADSNATVTEYVTLLPVGALNLTSGSTTASSLRLYSASSDAQIDYDGNMWDGADFFESGGQAYVNGDYPPWRNSNNSNWNCGALCPVNAEMPAYNGESYSHGNDIQYNLIVPNGNYKVRLLFGALYDGNLSGPPSTITNSAQQGIRQMLESQGQIVRHNYNFMMNQPGYQMDYATPSDVYIPAKVTNNQLELAFRGSWTDNDGSLYPNGCIGCNAPQVNSLQIIPDSSAAHWAIDTQQVSTITPGSALSSPITQSGSYELGLEFYTTRAGYITGVRFYKQVGDTGTHTGSLWSVNGNYAGTQTGTMLASGRFSGETAGGWQTLTFSSPVAISANTLYAISYYCPSGSFMQYPNQFAPPEIPYTNGSLKGVISMWLSGSDAFPQNYSHTGYLVDPIFSTISNGTNPQTLYPSNSLPGQQIALYLEDWYTGLSDAQWSIVSGPGTIATGTDLWGNAYAYYTAPSTQPSAGSAVVIQAQSISTPSISATVPIYFTGSTVTGK